MGMNCGPRQCDEPTGALAAFDFDGTLTCRDSFVAFLMWLAGPLGFFTGLLKLIPAAVAYVIDRDRGALKAAAARQFLGRRTRAQIEAAAKQFCEARFEGLIRPDALRCWKAWRERGARLLIVTASPDLIVAPFARALGADRLIATRLAFDEHNRFAGALDGPNCRGPEKVTRLREYFGADLQLTAAYGDTEGDRDMLAIAETAGYKVFTARS